MFFELEFGQLDPITAECQFAFALVMLKMNNAMECIKYMQNAQMIFSNTLGEDDRKTKEVEAVLRKVESLINEAHH